ncbi:hypothetical protein BC332_05788 [Capsicum chinense]|nr:hypothetical protein BC332_05788 [Capsicum chinense]
MKGSKHMKGSKDMKRKHTEAWGGEPGKEAWGRGSEQEELAEPFNPAWKREWNEPNLSRRQTHKLINKHMKLINKYLRSGPSLRSFDKYSQNQNLEIYTKSATLKASSSVVSIEFKRYTSAGGMSGIDAMFQCSGFILENVYKGSIILTTADLLKASKNLKADDIKVEVHLSDGRSFDGQIEVYDLYYNIAAIKIHSDMPLPTASLAHLNDSITVDPSHSVKAESFQLRPHANSLDLIPGDLVIALGRFPIEPYSIMAAPGLFSIDRFEHCLLQCKELFTASCIITWCGIGGPLISRSGEVIGISLKIDISTTAFLPINIASIWWEHYKKHGQTQQLWFGMEVTNLYAARLDVLESIIQKFPDVLEGVIVEDVVRGSSAESAGIKQHDVIIQFSGKRIQSFLELFENMWNKVGEAVELVVVRASDDVPLHLSMVVEKEVKKSGYTLYDYDE